MVDINDLLLHESVFWCLTLKVTIFCSGGLSGGLFRPLCLSKGYFHGRKYAWWLPSCCILHFSSSRRNKQAYPEWAAKRGILHMLQLLSSWWTLNKFPVLSLFSHSRLLNGMERGSIWHHQQCLREPRNIIEHTTNMWMSLLLETYGIVATSCYLQI